MSDFVFATAIYASGDWESAPNLPANLIDSVARYTTIDVAPTGVNVALESSEIFRYPFIWMTGHLPVRLTDAERANLLRYVERGGFFVIDDHNHDIDGPFHKTAMEEIDRTFTRTVGQLVDLPKHHALYSSFFVFADGPPNTQQELNGWGDNILHETLKAILVRDRIGLIYSNKDYSSEWNTHPDTKRFATVDNTKFGVNMIVYALTR